MARQFGDEQVKQWRRSYDLPPPALTWDDKRHPRYDERYKKLALSALPDSECLKDTVARVIPYWEDVIAPRIHEGPKNYYCCSWKQLACFD